MQIFIHNTVGTTLVMDITSSHTIQMIKYYILNKIGIPTRHQLLIYNGKVMPEYGNYPLENNDIIHLRLRLNQMPRIF
jgi:hypothetical protein